MHAEDGLKMIEATTMRHRIKDDISVGNRRRSPRFTISLPLSFHPYPQNQNSDDCSGQLINASGHGLYFLTESWLDCGIRLDLTLDFSNEKSSSFCSVIHAKVQVVRCEEASHGGLGKVGVAVQIEHFLV